MHHIYPPSFYLLAWINSECGIYFLHWALKNAIVSVACMPVFTIQQCNASHFIDAKIAVQSQTFTANGYTVWFGRKGSGSSQITEPKPHWHQAEEGWWRESQQQSVLILENQQSYSELTFYKGHVKHLYEYDWIILVTWQPNRRCINEPMTDDTDRQTWECNFKSLPQAALILHFICASPHLSAVTQYDD